MSCPLEFIDDVPVIEIPDGRRANPRVRTHG